MVINVHWRLQMSRLERHTTNYTITPPDRLAGGRGVEREVRYIRRMCNSKSGYIRAVSIV